MNAKHLDSHTGGMVYYGFSSYIVNTNAAVTHEAVQPTVIWHQPCCAAKLVLHTYTEHAGFVYSIDLFALSIDCVACSQGLLFSL